MYLQFIFDVNPFLFSEMSEQKTGNFTIIQKMHHRAFKPSKLKRLLDN